VDATQTVVVIPGAVATVLNSHVVIKIDNEVPSTEKGVHQDSTKTSVNKTLLLHV
jgi:hypothetical protein